MASAPAIGIDLGTTFSLAAVHINGKTEVIPDKEGERLIPSCVYYDPDSSDIYVGSTAEDLGRQQIDNFLYDIKRIIGRKFDDVYVQKIKNSQEYKFDVIRGKEAKAEIQIVNDGLIVSKTPEEISSEILKYLRNAASNYLGTEVSEAVISVPARFSNAQRKATRAAAELAGLKVLKLITEPVAAAIHYCEERLQTEGHLLVVDFGGGTLDVSIIDVKEKTFFVKSVEGDTFLGGRDFDEILLERFKADMLDTFGAELLSDYRVLDRLKQNCTRIKRKLSTLEEFSLIQEFVGGIEGNDYTISITRPEFENLVNSLITRCINIVGKCLVEAGLSKSDIKEVVLVGGTTRIPKIRETISDFFNQKELKTDLNPDEAVALGAAMQAALLKTEFKEFEKYKITEVTPLSLGDCVHDNLFSVMIKKNTPLPYKSTPGVYYTSENNQTTCRFEVYEGDRKNCQYNNLLGSFTIDGLPPGKAGDVRFEETFYLNEDGILEVEAWETTTNKRNKLVVTIGDYSLCEYKLRHCSEDAFKNRLEDEQFEIFVRYKSKIEKVCKHLLYDLDAITGQTEKNIIEQKCNKFKKYLEIMNVIDVERLRSEYNDFRKDIKPIAIQYSLQAILKNDTEIFEIVLNRVKESSFTFYSN